MDITDRKRAEAELRESEERFRTVFDNATDSMFIVETMERGGLIVDANDSASEVLGYSRDELIGMPSMQIEAPELTSVPELLPKVLAGERLTFETVCVREDGSRVPLET